MVLQRVARRANEFGCLTQNRNQPRGFRSHLYLPYKKGVTFDSGNAHRRNPLAAIGGFFNARLGSELSRPSSHFP